MTEQENKAIVERFFDELYQKGNMDIFDELLVPGFFFAGVGAEVQGQPLVLTIEVTSYEPNSRFGFKTTSGPIQAQQAFAFEPVEGGTRLAMVLELADPQMAAPARQQWDNDLLILKKLLETQE